MQIKVSFDLPNTSILKLQNASQCLPVRIRISKTAGRFAKISLCMLSISVAQSSSGSVAICYVLSVLLMMSCLHKEQAKRK